MFQPGDLVVYGPTGVCRVEAVTCSKPSQGEKERPYYRLRPLHQDGVIYTPADQTRIPIRPVISAQEAEASSMRSPPSRPRPITPPPCSCSPGTTRSCTHRQLPGSGGAGDVGLCQAPAGHGQGPPAGAVDERFSKQAQQLLHSELAVALGIPCEEVPDYIARRVEARKATGA